MVKHYSTLLTIAGSDPIGGAGIQADIKTSTTLGVYSMSVITAVTAQNTKGVVCYEEASEKILRAQLEAVLDDVRPDAVKIGMLPSTRTVGIVAEYLKKYELTNVVLDPVCVSTSGHSLTSESVPWAMTEKLFPLVKLITPNIPEGEVFLGKPINTLNKKTAVLELSEKYLVENILLKGGHENNTFSTDVLLSGEKIIEYEAPRIDTPNTHGTGCSLSSAIASYLSLGCNIPEAVELAKKWLTTALNEGKDYQFGHGFGPIYFFTRNC